MGPDALRRTFRCAALFARRKGGRLGVRAVASVVGRGLSAAIAMVAAVLICGAAVAFSAESSGPVAAPVGSDPSGKSPRDPSGEASQRDPLLQEAKRASKQAADAAEKHRASAEGKQERLASKTAFRGMSGEDAKVLYWKKFPKLAKKASWRPLAAFAGDEINVLSPFSAVVQTDSTRPGQLLTSVGVPLGVGEGGRFKPADARLTSTDDAFRPRASVVGTRIGKRLATGVTVDQVTMTLVDAEDVAGVEVDDKVFYANVEQDTDLVVVTTPTGIETFAQLRTPESPEREKFAIGMPQGATLQATQDGGAEIVADRQKLAQVHPPQAVDAQGRSVPVEMAVEGEHLIVTTHHRNGDFAYPVVSDPALTDYWDSGSDKWDGAGEWNTYSHSATAMSFPTSGSFGDGRYIHAPPGIYYNGNWGEWSLPAYGQSFFSRAWFYDNILEYNSPERGRDQHWFDLNSGIWSRQQGRWTDVWNWGGETLWGDDVAVEPNAGETSDPDYRTGDLLVMQLLSHASFGRDYWTGAFVGGVVAAQDDHNVPWLSSVVPGPEASRWSGGPTSVRLTAQDVGLGVKHIGVYRPGGEEVRTHPCSGHQRSRCPHSWNDQVISMPTQSWPEGVQRLGAHTTDIIGRQSAQRQWDVKIDRTAPEVTVTGQLLDETLNMTGQDLYSVRIEARDGDPNGPAGSRRSGVAHARVLVDGIEQQRRETASTCVDSCTLTDEYELDTDDFAEGDHTVRIEVQDRAGNPPFTKQWTISIPGERRYTQAIANWRADVEQRVDRALPAVGLTSPMPAPPDWWRRESECLASEDALRRCFEDNWSWGQSVEQWLQDNGGPAVAGDELPAYPIFVYAPSPELPVDLTQGTAGAWEVARRAATSTDVAAASTGVSATSTAVSVGVDLSFREPLSLAQTTALLTTLGVPAVSNLRGVFDAAGAGITGENEYAGPEMPQRLDQSRHHCETFSCPRFSKHIAATRLR